MKKLIELKLKVLAKMIVKKYKPEIIGITGSVGKTTTKEAVYTVLKSKFRVRRSRKNYNNEIGVPLTIINADSPGKSIFGWLLIIIKALKLVIIKDRDYPEKIVMEMGVDRPGDMQYLHSIVKPKVGVVTMIGPSHMEYFHSVEKIKEEKGYLIKNLNHQSWAILNYDNEFTRRLAAASKARVLTFGLGDQADVRAIEVNFSFEKAKIGEQPQSQIPEIDKLRGISFKILYRGSAVPVLLPNTIGFHSIYAALAAAAVGLSYKMNLIDISNALKNFYSPPGRLNLIKGIKHTIIIDDSYNSSPQSSLNAIDTIKKIPISKENKRYAVLGDMLELGTYTEQGHKEVGEYVAMNGFQELIVVGERARDIKTGAEAAGMLPEHVFQFGDSESAGKFIQERIRQGDLIFVKGSARMRMEKIVKELMAEPLRAKELLVRQEEEWLRR